MQTGHQRLRVDVAEVGEDADGVGLDDRDEERLHDDPEHEQCDNDRRKNSGDLLHSCVFLLFTLRSGSVLGLSRRSVRLRGDRHVRHSLPDNARQMLLPHLNRGKPDELRVRLQRFTLTDDRVSILLGFRLNPVRFGIGTVPDIERLAFALTVTDFFAVKSACSTWTPALIFLLIASWNGRIRRRRRR